VGVTSDGLLRPRIKGSFSNSILALDHGTRHKQPQTVDAKARRAVTPLSDPRCQIPSDYRRRVIEFAHFRNIHLIWTDKESIYQEDKLDLAMGINSMCPVYRDSTLSLGLLTVIIECQEHLHSLLILLCRRVFSKDLENSKFKDWVNTETASKIIDTLRLVLSDERWERAWISLRFFQDD